MLAAFCIAAATFFLLAGYELARSASASLFLEAYSSDRLAVVLALGPVGTFLFLYGYARILSRVGPRNALIVTSLARAYNPSNWFHYRMSITEVALIVGSFAWFFMFFLVFVRVLPAFSIAEIKETLPMPRRRDH